ncbi:MAG: hypothetical protein B6D65_05050 [candidate division Zixibacteria bacterium 4484_93]|nr:MAG: hypothetical protein B6D65_05050 [candidate division Zixibacteria bacterium 4484_93]
MKVGYLQFHPERLAVDKNIKRVIQFLESVEAELVVLPELFATGYLFSSKRELLSVAEKFPDGETIKAISDIAKEKDMAIAGGFPEISNNKIFNSQFLVSPAGEFLYRKVHLFNGEKYLFAPGDTGFVSVELKGIKIGLMVCFDWLFPEAARTLALKGAQVIAHSANLVMPYCQKAMYARAVENRVFTITSNRIGSESVGGKKLTFTGGSIIYSPTGKILAEGSTDSEEITIVEIDPTEALDKNITGDNNIFDDRRTRLYFR